MVLIRPGRFSFARRPVICTSRVRDTATNASPQIRSISCWRLTADPGRSTSASTSSNSFWVRATGSPPTSTVRAARSTRTSPVVTTGLDPAAATAARRVTVSIRAISSAIRGGFTT
jgi:hypothetical protein